MDRYLQLYSRLFLFVRHNLLKPSCYSPYRQCVTVPKAALTRTSPTGLGFQSVKLVRVWSVTGRTLADYIYIYIYIYIYPSLAPELSSPRGTREPYLYVYGHL
jgi:hypothetical protein